MDGVATMKVLVVDDNIAIQEILKDILVDEGHSVKIAGSIDEAVTAILDFRPEAILLDTVVNDEDGLQILAHAYEKNHEINLDTVLIKSAAEEVPQDNMFIKAVVNKPFKSSDITAALATLKSIKEQEQAEMGVKPRKKGRGLLSKLGTKKKDEPAKHIDTDETALVAEYIASEGPMYGRSYVFFEKEPSKIYDFLKIFSPRDYDILVISSENTKAVKQNFGQDDIEVATISSNGRGRSMDINALGTLTVFIKDFMSRHSRPIVLIEDFTEIIDSNGLNHSLVFIHQLVKDKDAGLTASVVISVDPSILTTKDRNILLGDMSEYSN